MRFSPSSSAGDLGQVVRVLEQRLRERRDHALVHGQQLGQLAGLEAVVTLEVDDLDGAGGGHLVDQLGRPGGRDVELEAQTGMDLEPAPDRVEGRRFAEPERVDEAQRPRLAADGLVQRQARLVEREVERGGLERPPAPAHGRVPLRRLRPHVELREPIGERLQRPLAAQRQLRRGHVQRDGLVLERRDVLAEALGAVAAQADQRRHALEGGAVGRRPPLELVGLHVQRQGAEPIPGGLHSPDPRADDHLGNTVAP